MDPDCWTSDITSVTQEFDPDYKTSEEDTVTQELDPGGGNGDLQKVGQTMDLLDPGLNGRRVTCISIVLMILILAVSSMISTLGSQESLYGTLGLGGIFLESGTQERPLKLWTYCIKESNLFNRPNMVKPLFFVENDVGQTF